MRKRKTIKIGQKVIFDPLQYGICYIPCSAPEYVIGIIAVVAVMTVIILTVNAVKSVLHEIKEDTKHE